MSWHRDGGRWVSCETLISRYGLKSAYTFNSRKRMYGEEKNCKAEEDPETEENSRNKARKIHRVSPSKRKS